MTDMPDNLHPHQKVPYLEAKILELEEQLNGWKTRCEQLSERLDDEANSRMKFQFENMDLNEELDRYILQAARLTVAGTLMSNACYNLAQYPERLPNGQAQSLKQMQVKWDALVRNQTQAKEDSNE